MNSKTTEQTPVRSARRRLDPPAAPTKAAAWLSDETSERRKFFGERRLKSGRATARAGESARAKVLAERRAVIAHTIKTKLSPEGESAKRRLIVAPAGRQFASSENSSR